RSRRHFAQGRFHNFRLAYLGERLRVDVGADAAPQLPKDDRDGIRVDGLLDIRQQGRRAYSTSPSRSISLTSTAGLRSGRVDVEAVMADARRKRPIDPYH